MMPQGADLLREASATGASGAPYEEAGPGCEARCCRSIGDEDTANSRQEAARKILDTIGAALTALYRALTTAARPRLTSRERSEDPSRRWETPIRNATELFLAVKTIDRHVSKSHQAGVSPGRGDCIASKNGSYE